jgi:hypothetical protein
MHLHFDDARPDRRERHASPRDVRAEAWAVVAPEVPRITTDAPQRAHRLREVFPGRRWPNHVTAD